MTINQQHSILNVKNLAIGYPSKKKLLKIAKGINFNIPKGKLISIVGTNGIGKSTLIRTLAGMQPSLMGQILINNKDLQEYTPLQLAQQLSIVLTESPSSKNLTVLELVSLGRHPYTNWIGKLSENDKRIIIEALKLTETSDLANKKCLELSDGQMQRVMIARALAQDSSIILLDEPTTHLDIYHRAYLLKLLKKLTTEQQKTIIFSTHEIEIAIQVSDSMIVMEKDEVFYNSPQDLINNNCFNHLFPSETIYFDKELKRFVLKD